MQMTKCPKLLVMVHKEILMVNVAKESFEPMLQFWRSLGDDMGRGQFGEARGSEKGAHLDNIFVGVAPACAVVGESAGKGYARSFHKSL